MWAHMAFKKPLKTLARLMDHGYSGDPNSVLRISSNKPDRRFRKPVFQCLVFGPKKSGKTALLNALRGRAFSEDYNPDTTERLAVITVDRNREAMKTLILREIPETRATDIVSDEDSMAACDVALFVHDSSREGRERLKLFAQLAQVVGSGFKVPCFIVDAKDDDLGMRLEFKRRTKCFGLQRIPVNLKLGEFNDLACRIVEAAEHPHRNLQDLQVLLHELESSSSSTSGE